MTLPLAPHPLTGLAREDPSGTLVGMLRASATLAVAALGLLIGCTPPHLVRGELHDAAPLDTGALLDAANEGSQPDAARDTGSFDAAVSLDGGDLHSIDAAASGKGDSGDARADVADSGTDATAEGGTDGDASLSRGDAGADAGGKAEACPAQNTCDAARPLQALSGDEAAPSRVTQGQGSEFLEIEITDRVGVFNSDETLKARITLTSPPEANYDLVVKVLDGIGGAATAPRGCSAEPRSDPAGQETKTVSVTWSDVANLPGETAGDARIVSVEVRHVSGNCDAQWTLLVEGNAD